MAKDENCAMVTQPENDFVSVGSLFTGLIDKEMEAKVEKVVIRLIEADDRFYNPDIETIDAIRDWVRAEAAFNIVFSRFMKGDTTSSNDRMFRTLFIQKNALRDEIFGKFKNKKAKEEEINQAEKIMIDTGVIEPKKEVDILAD